jgi:serine/threonine protein kinase
MNADAADRPPKADKGPDMAALEAGQTIFEYRIDKVLGGGGFGITYLAQDINLQLPVALKEYFPSSLAVRAPDRSVRVRSAEGSGQFDWGLERFIDEARALASFRHPNIVRVLRYFKENGTAYIVMEYESGEPLKYWLARQNGLDQSGLLKLVYPLLDGLEAVHKLNFLHRDIKPDNIYIRADGTPVLLDFGAARRLTSDQDMTNIVSPGFAPFEQYHSKGNQGPWTDLYSLGAVLYWLTTRTKPMESASRVQDDTMPKAAVLASSAQFGEQLLQTIDWALQPHEKKRPQSVAELRQAFKDSENIRTQVLTTRRTENNPAALQSPNVLSRPFNAEEALRKNVMGTIMFLDLVAYSTFSVDQQVAIKTLFNELIHQAIRSVEESSRILLDTGDGAAICFLGDPEEALRASLLLRDLLQQRYREKLSMRVGLHMGPVRMLMDINNRVNVVGDGINVAQRIMDFSQANQITVSRAYYDVISRISDGAQAMFEFLGTRLDKHQRSYDLYALVDPSAARHAAAPNDTTFEPTRVLADVQTIAPADIQLVELELTQAIGPLAHVLVKKAVPRAGSAQNLRDLLAVSIQDAATREAFMHPRSHSSRLASTASFASSAVQALADSLTRPLSQRTGLVSGQPLSRPTTPSGPATGTPAAPSGSTSVSASLSLKVHTFSAEQQTLLERALSRHIGPLAKTLVRKEAARQAHWSDLLQALAQHIDKPGDRATFLSEAGKFQNS